MIDCLPTQAIAFEWKPAFRLRERLTQEWENMSRGWITELLPTPTMSVGVGIGRSRPSVKP